MSTKYNAILRYMSRVPLAILPDKLDEVLLFLELKANGGDVAAEDIEAATRGRKASGAKRSNGVQVIPIYGSIFQKANLINDISSPGGTSTEQVGRLIDAAVADDEISTILLDVDSPGGSVYGVDELSAKIYEARQQKRIVASVNSLAASAAYYIASAASEIAITPTGEAGSIGVFTVHWDQSVALEDQGLTPTVISAGKYKVEGNPYEPLSDEARERLQDNVDRYYSMFVEAVARNRAMSVELVKKDFGQGRTLGAREAYSVGMVDIIEPFEATLVRLLGGKPTASRGPLVQEMEYDFLMLTN